MSDCSTECRGNLGSAVGKSERFLGEFEKLRKATVSFVMSVRPSVCPHGTTRLPLDGFLFKMSISRLSVEKIQISLKPDTNKGYFTSSITSRSLLLGKKNILDKRCTETRNTFYFQ
jgi:hypothetical protein